jgi:aspartate/methionine/tyrosine aminotransferase
MPSNEGYRAFIKEAFIKPIRSVLIVDDDYPTYSEILELQKSKITAGQVEKPSSKLWRTDPDKIMKVIDSFRKDASAALRQSFAKALRCFSPTVAAQILAASLVRAF